MGAVHLGVRGKGKTNLSTLRTESWSLSGSPLPISLASACISWKLSSRASLGSTWPSSPCSIICWWQGLGGWCLLQVGSGVWACAAAAAAPTSLTKSSSTVCMASRNSLRPRPSASDATMRRCFSRLRMSDGFLGANRVPSGSKGGEARREGAWGHLPLQTGEWARRNRGGGCVK